MVTTRYIVHMVVELEDEQDVEWVKEVVKDTLIEGIESVKTVKQVKVFKIALG